jgi:ankyrin repeat protein
MEFAVREMRVACERGNVDKVKHLLAWGVDANEEVDGYTLLETAARGGNHVVVKTLLKADAKPSLPALVAGVLSGSRHTADHIADALHFAGENPAAFPWGTVLGKRENLEQLTAEMAQWLVDAEVDMSETDSFGRSIADLAAKYARRDVAEILARHT